MNNIIEVAKNKAQIMTSQNIYCPLCGHMQFSLFDKLYTKAYGKCVDCSMPEEIEQNGKNIIAIL